MVGLYELVSSILDFQVTATLSRELGELELTHTLSRAFALMNVTALFVQCFLTAPLLRRFGLGFALLVLPATLLVASVGMLALPVVTMASLVPALDSGFAHSIQQSAREILYVPLGAESKHRAKALVDVFFVRAAKGVGVLLTLGLSIACETSAQLRALSLVSVLALGLWAICALRVARSFEARETTQGGAHSALPVRRAVVP